MIKEKSIFILQTVKVEKRLNIGWCGNLLMGRYLRQRAEVKTRKVAIRLIINTFINNQTE